MNSFQQPIDAEPGGGQWHKFEDPGTGSIASKTSGWTADSFSGGFEVDFSSVKREGMRAVRCRIFKAGISGFGAWARASGDANISNTPVASFENSQQIIADAGVEVNKVVALWLSSDYKVQFAVQHVDMDLYVAYPKEYML